MRILIISWFFPPANTMGALRVGRMAQYLTRSGHEVRVVASRFQPPSPQLEWEPECRVVRTRWYDINAFPKRVADLLRGRRRVPGHHDSSRPTTGDDSSGGTRSDLLGWLARTYETVVNFPDHQVGWVPFALKAVRNETRDFAPDVVFATAPPFSAVLAAAIVTRKRHWPLVVEMRDRWSDDPYRETKGLRGWCERTLERRILARAAGIVTVSQPWADAYTQAHGKPSVAVMNGYDPDDIAAAWAMAGVPSPTDKLVIRHVGRIYPGRRDPSPLFAALADMPVEARAQVQVEFIGGADGIAELAARSGVEGSVMTHPPVSHREALRCQMDADIVLLLQWNGAAERGNVPGKLFEYLATHRPILGHGDPEGVPAGIISRRDAGLYSNDPEEVRAFVEAKLAEKRRLGYVSATAEAASQGFDRDSAYRVLEQFLHNVSGIAGTEARELRVDERCDQAQQD